MGVFFRKTIAPPSRANANQAVNDATKTMAKHSKRFKEVKKAVDKLKIFTAAEAIELVKQTSTAKFDETLEVHFRLGINASKGDQQVRGTVILPHSFGATKKVVAFVTEDKAKEAKEAGADVVYTESDIADFQKNPKMDFDIAIAVPDMMKVIAPLARILGPKGLMPSPKNETVSTNLKKTLDEVRKGKVAFKNDTTSNVHVSIGKKSMTTEQILENFKAIFDAIAKAKPETSKGIYLKNIVMAATMGPGVKVELK